MEGDEIPGLARPVAYAHFQGMLSTTPAERLLSFLSERSWREVLGDEFQQPYMAAIAKALEEAEQAALKGAAAVTPARCDIFRALNLVPVDAVRVVILGQDPFPTLGDADGLAFSVQRDSGLPGALSKILAEARRDLGWRRRTSGDLTPWTSSGVLLLNTVLTNLVGETWAHGDLGWQEFTRAVLETVAHRSPPSAILLWGSEAKEFAPVFERTHHKVFTSDHPNGRRLIVQGSLHRAFKGSRPFSNANNFLRGHRLPDGSTRPEVDWALPDAAPRATSRRRSRPSEPVRPVRRRK